MKRILCIATLLFCMSFAGSAMTQDKSKSTTHTFAGFNYQGDVGFLFGTGQTVGRVTIVPFARFSIDSTLTDELRFKKTFGAETIIWMLRAKQIKLGLIASVFTLDWLDNQEESIGTYITQSAGLSLHWQIVDGFALNVAAKGKAQLFQRKTSYRDRFAIYVVAVTDKLAFLKLF